MKGLLVVVRSLAATPLASRMKLTGQVAMGGWDKAVLGSLFQNRTTTTTATTTITATTTTAITTTTTIISLTTTVAMA